MESIVVAVSEDFNNFFFHDDVAVPRTTPIDQFAHDYLGLNIDFAPLFPCGKYKHF